VAPLDFAAGSSHFAIMNDINPALLARYDGLRIPRYTSYPTAPHFGPSVDGEAYRAWLGALGPDAVGSLYLHIPFCRKMCWFCGCHTKVVARYEPVAEYLARLRREVAMVADAIPQRLKVRHIHFGGGTPTILEPDDFRALLGDLFERFAVVDGAEVAVEIDPRVLTAEMAAALAAGGVNRASLGVQDFDAGVQEAINRVQPVEVTALALERLRGAGIAHINLDLMYGLPKQGVAEAERSAYQAVELKPDRLAVFGYAHVPWMKTHQKLIAEADLADGRGRWEQYSAIARVLTGAGYRSVGLDHFARADDELAVRQAEGRLARNFQGYTTDDADALLGFGSSAIGFLPQGYVQNAVPFHEYDAALEAGRFATVKGFALEPEDRLRRAVIERLMCDLTVDVGALAERHGRPVSHFDAELSGMGDLVDDGVVAVAGRRLTLPETARPLMRIVAARFDTYLGSGPARHSRAV
jgi:oxygen-independent coproporphyrinogen III oxidase